MALPLLSRMISWPNSNIHDFSRDPSSLLQVHSSSHYLYCLQTYCFIHVVISRPNRYLFILARSGPFCYKFSLGPTLMAQPLAFMVLFSIVKSLIITSALMLHVDVFHDGNTIAICPIKTFCAIQVLHHIILSPESLLHTLLQFTSTLMSISPRGTKENPPIS